MPSQEGGSRQNPDKRMRFREQQARVREKRKREKNVRKLVANGTINAEMLESLINDLDAHQSDIEASSSVVRRTSVGELENYLECPGLSEGESKRFLQSMLKEIKRIERESAEAKRGRLLMSGSDCVACNAKHGVLAAAVGTKGNPSGCCVNCHAFSCEHHGIRDSSVPEYRCVQCDKNLLCASAVVQAQTTNSQGITAELADVAAGYTRYRTEQLAPSSRWVVRTVDQFIERRPAYGEEFLSQFYRANPRLNPQKEPSHESIAWSLQWLPTESAKLVRLALFICREFELVGLGADPVLRRAVESLRWG
jgi:hypothetical protein